MPEEGSAPILSNCLIINTLTKKLKHLFIVRGTNRGQHDPFSKNYYSNSNFLKYLYTDLSSGPKCIILPDSRIAALIVNEFM